VPTSGKKKMTITVSLSFGLRARPGASIFTQAAKTVALKPETRTRFLEGAACRGLLSSTAWTVVSDDTQKSRANLFAPMRHLFGGSAAAWSQILGRVANKI
jgi:hypothetical protein